MENNEKTRVLFVCIHNSARSQMAEALMNDIAGDRFEAHSAGIETGTLNPLAVEVMKERGIDISGKSSQLVFDLFRASERFRYVVPVCDSEAAERCPIFPGVSERVEWSFSDPSKFEGTHEEKLEQTRAVRDEIEAKIREFVSK